MSDQRLIKIGEMWERVSAKGTRYFSGFLGDAQLLLFEAGERDHPSRPGEKVKVWNLLVGERNRPAQREGPEAGSP